MVIYSYDFCNNIYSPLGNQLPCPSVAESEGGEPSYRGIKGVGEGKTLRCDCNSKKIGIRYVSEIFLVALGGILLAPTRSRGATHRKLACSLSTRALRFPQRNK